MTSFVSSPFLPLPSPLSFPFPLHSSPFPPPILPPSFPPFYSLPSPIPPPSLSLSSLFLLPFLPFLYPCPPHPSPPHPSPPYSLLLTPLLPTLSSPPLSSLLSPPHPSPPYSLLPQTGQTILHYACALGQVDVILYLLSRPDCKLSEQDKVSQILSDDTWADKDTNH